MVGSLWCADKLLKLGYPLSSENLWCKMRGDAIDSLHHRLWVCHVSKEAREKIFKHHPEELEAAKKSDPDDPLYARALPKYPDMVWPENGKG